MSGHDSQRLYSVHGPDPRCSIMGTTGKIMSIGTELHTTRSYQCLSMKSATNGTEQEQRNGYSEKQPRCLSLAIYKYITQQHWYLPAHPIQDNYDLCSTQDWHLVSCSKAALHFIRSVRNGERRKHLSDLSYTYRSRFGTKTNQGYDHKHLLNLLKKRG